MVVAAAEGSGHQLAGAIQHTVLWTAPVLWGNSRQEGNAALLSFFHSQIRLFDLQALPIQKHCVF
jgi:hypothetical protein